MTTEFIWQLPTSGDGRYGNARKVRRAERTSADHPYSEGVSDPRGRSFNYFDYLHQVALAADLVRFDGIRIPDDPQGDEPWIVAGYVARGARHLKLLTEFEASRGSSVYAAKNAVSFLRFTGERFAWQLSVGPDARQRSAQGDTARDADRLARIEEFVAVARGVIHQAPFSFKGRFFEVSNGGFRGPLGNHEAPPVYLSGKSEEALRLSARVADVHVFEAAPVAALGREIERLRTLARESGRNVSAGIRIDVVARETEEEAVFDARRGWDQYGLKRAGGDPSASHDLWVESSRDSTGAATTIVGSYEQVAQALVEYAKEGVESFLLSATPHLEEAYRFGEHVLPPVRAQLTPGHRRVA